MHTYEYMQELERQVGVSVADVCILLFTYAHVSYHVCMHTNEYMQELERQVGVSVADMNARYQRDAEKRAVAAKKADR